MKRYLPLLFFPIVFTVGAYSYYGGGTLNHGHTTAPGDGGALSNPAISGTATVTGISLSTLVVSGDSTLNRSIITQSTVTNLTATNLTVSQQIAASTITQLNSSTITSSFKIFVDTGGTVQKPAYSFGPNAYLVGPEVGMYFANEGGYIGFAYGGKSLVQMAVGSGQSILRVPEKIGPVYSGYPVNIVGSTTPAPSTYIGEIISSETFPTASGFPTSGSYGNLAAITLTPGIWMVNGSVASNANGATVTFIVMGSTVITGDNPPSGNLCRTDTNFGPSAVNDITTRSDGCLYDVDVTTTVFLKYRANYSVATPKATGKIQAVRIQ